MASYIVKRCLYLVPTLIAISIVVFIVIQLPPGDYVTTYVMRLEQEGVSLSQHQIDQMREMYGLDKPMHIRYLKWMAGIFRGDFGFSFEWNRPVAELIGGRLALTVAVSLTSLIFTWVVSFVIGFYSATHQYSVGDYLATFIGFIGLATPNFMLALVLMWFAYSRFGFIYGGLFSPEYAMAPWGMGKFFDMLKNLWLPVLVIGTSGTAGQIRILRANLLDELAKPYVTTARAKGLSEIKLVLKYPVRIALIPFVSTAGWRLSSLVSGSVVTATVLNLPTTGPMLLAALKSQDMYLAGSFILFLSLLTVVGTLLSDILLAALDPRIRYQ
ncbi:MAG: ABC transporter permease [Firmicutes bacterium]|nr:ABC transporter permease [Bacillota bacterium]